MKRRDKESYSLQSIKMVGAQLLNHLGNTFGTLVIVVDACGLNEAFIERL